MDYLEHSEPERGGGGRSVEFYLGLDSALAYKGLKQGQVINRSRVEFFGSHTKTGS